MAKSVNLYSGITPGSTDSPFIRFDSKNNFKLYSQMRIFNTFTLAANANKIGYYIQSLFLNCYEVEIDSINIKVNGYATIYNNLLSYYVPLKSEFLFNSHDYIILGCFTNESIDNIGTYSLPISNFLKNNNYNNLFNRNIFYSDGIFTDSTYVRRMSLPLNKENTEYFTYNYKQNTRGFYITIVGIFESFNHTSNLGDSGNSLANCVFPYNSILAPVTSDCGNGISGHRYFVKADPDYTYINDWTYYINFSVNGRILK